MRALNVPYGRSRSAAETRRISLASATFVLHERADRLCADQLNMEVETWHLAVPLAHSRGALGER